MPLLHEDRAVRSPKRPARDIIDAVVENMRENLEQLKYSTLAPSRYTVYLHPDEFARLEGIVAVLREQTIRALTEELARLNGRSRVRRLTSRIFRDAEPEVRSAGAEWLVEFLPDPDGEMNAGDLLVDSELLLPARPELGVGQRTRRVTTVRTAGHTTIRERTIGGTQPSSLPPTLGRIEYDDDEGHHWYEIVKDSFTIGRGGIAYPVDLRVTTSPDVSREHARIRRDPDTNQFFLIDLSSLGTTLNGRHVPKGYGEVDGAKRENGAETPLPDNARIGLANTVFLEFRREG